MNQLQPPATEIAGLGIGVELQLVQVMTGSYAMSWPVPEPRMCCTTCVQAANMLTMISDGQILIYILQAFKLQSPKKFI